jgi:hypothetical protein
MKFKDALQKSVQTLSSSEFRNRVKEEDERMLSHLPLLQKINQAGFLTVNSQGGEKQSGKSVLDGKHYELSERAYLIGFLLETKAASFLQKVSIITDKNAIYVPLCQDSVSIPSSLDIPLTITKKGGKTTVETHSSVVLPESVWHSFRKQAHISKSEKVVFILCWDTKWNRNASGPSGLFQDILKILKTI